MIERMRETGTEKSISSIDLRPRRLQLIAVGDFQLRLSGHYRTKVLKENLNEKQFHLSAGRETINSSE